MENEGRELYGIPAMTGHGPAGIKFGNMGDYGYGLPAEVKNADYYKDYTDEEIDNLRKEAEVVIPASKGKVTSKANCFFREQLICRQRLGEAKWSETALTSCQGQSTDSRRTNTHRN